ncbi:MAG: hypothetical protein ACJ756_01615 [Solirubrobacterales bacterium]
MGRTDGALMERVRDELEAGSSLESLEHRIIEPTPLDEERRSALWLYAWSVSASHARRHSGLRPEADRAH